MVASLILVTVLQAQQIEAKLYKGVLSGPIFDGCILYADPEVNVRYGKFFFRPVKVTIAGGNVRCDTDDRLSVVKTVAGEYFMIDHGKKEALIFPAASSEAGRAAVCSTTPFWPEAYGDKTSFEALERAEILGDGAKGPWLESLPAIASSEGPQKYSYFELATPAGFSARFIYDVVRGEIDGFHNTSWYASDDAKSMFVYWRVSFRLPSGAPGEPSSSKNVSVSTSLFTYPDEYSLRVAGSSGAYPGEARANSTWIKEFVSGFEIRAAFPRSLIGL